MSQYEQLREDAKKVSTGSNEDVMGQVTIANQVIIHHREARKSFFISLWYSPKWETFPLIEIENKDSSTP